MSDGGGSFVQRSDPEGRRGSWIRTDSASMSRGQRNAKLVLVMVSVPMLELSPPSSGVCPRW